MDSDRAIAVGKAACLAVTDDLYACERFRSPVRVGFQVVEMGWDFPIVEEEVGKLKALSGRDAI